MGLPFAAALTVGCGASPPPPARPTATVEAAIREGVREWLGCSDTDVSIGERVTQTYRECVEYEPRAADEPEPDDVLGDLAQRPCRRWEEREDPPVPGSWFVEACGQMEEFSCGPVCGAGLTCMPSALRGRIDCAEPWRG